MVHPFVFTCYLRRNINRQSLRDQNLPVLRWRPSARAGLVVHDLFSRTCLQQSVFFSVRPFLFMDLHSHARAEVLFSVTC